MTTTRKIWLRFLKGICILDMIAGTIFLYSSAVTAVLTFTGMVEASYLVSLCTAFVGILMMASADVFIKMVPLK